MPQLSEAKPLVCSPATNRGLEHTPLEDCFPLETVFLLVGGWHPP